MTFTTDESANINRMLPKELLLRFVARDYDEIKNIIILKISCEEKLLNVQALRNDIILIRIINFIFLHSAV